MSVINSNILRSTLVAIVATSSFISFGQKMGAYDHGNPDYYYPAEIFSISASPLALVDFYNGSAYKAGISFRPSREYRITADGGGYLTLFDPAGTSDQQVQ